MQRRTLLSALGVGAASAAGCAAPLTGSDPDETTQPTTRSGETTTDGGDTPPTADDGAWESRVVDLETGPRTLSAMVGSGPYPNVSVDGEFVETATPDHPARLQVTVRNDAEYEQVVELDTLHFISGLPLRGTPEEDDSRIGLRFPPVADHRLASEVPDVERGESGYWRVASTDRYWHPDRVTLAGEETVAGEFWVVGDDSSDGFPTGQYGREDAPRIVAWNTDSPGPAGESRFADADVPDLPTGETEWYHDAGPGTTTYVEPERERTTLPAGLEFTFYNRRREWIGCGTWSLWKRHERSWHHLAPHGTPLVCPHLAAGATDTWRLVVTNGPPVDVGSEDNLETDQSVGFLGGGQYAFETYDSPEEDDTTTAALFEVEAPAVAVTSRDGTTAERDGDTVTVTAPAREDDGAERAELVVTRVADAEEVILAEQVMREPLTALRDALAVFDADAERVVVRTDEYSAEGVVGHDGDSRRFEFRDGTYEATIRRDV